MVPTQKKPVEVEDVFLPFFGEGGGVWRLSRNEGVPPIGCKQPPRQGESCGFLGGVCRNSTAACAERRGVAKAPLLCHCEVEKPPVKDSKLQRTQQENELLKFFLTNLTLELGRGIPIDTFVPECKK